MLQVDGLPDATVARSCWNRSPTRPVAPDVARRIVAETQGCPLAVTELAGELTSEQLAGARVLPDPMPISGRLERHYLAQIRRLPPETQLVMLIAAAEPTGDATTLWRAALRLGVTPDGRGPGRGDRPRRRCDRASSSATRSSGPPSTGARARPIADGFMPRSRR